MKTLWVFAPRRGPHPEMYESIQWKNIYYASADEEEPDYAEFQQITNLFFRLFGGHPSKSRIKRTT
jgi:hypothetical protein